MKDCKTRQKYVSKWLRMEFFLTAITASTFFSALCILSSQRTINSNTVSIQATSKRKSYTRPDINWRRFKDNVKRHEPYEKVPASSKG